MTNITNFEQVIYYCKQKKQVGDTLTLSKIAGITTEAVRMRLHRKDKVIYQMLYELIESREKLIKQHKHKSESVIKL